MRRFLGFAMIACAVTAAWGQDISGLRAKTELSAEERTALQKWIKGQVESTLAADADAARRLREALINATPQYRRIYVEIYVDIVRPLVRDAEVLPAARLLAALQGVEEPYAARLFIEALSDKRPAMRLAGAAGLDRLKDALAKAGAKDVEQALAALRDAGKGESVLLNLEAIYRAMDYEKHEALRSASTEALLTLLEARADAYAERKPHAVGAEALAFKALQNTARALDEEGKKRLMRVAGQMMRYAVTRYTRDNELRTSETKRVVEEKDRIIEMTAQLETLLKGLRNWGPNPPDISSKMGAKDRSADIDIEIEMNRWAEELKKATGKEYFMQTDEPQPKGR